MIKPVLTLFNEALKYIRHLKNHSQFLLENPNGVPEFWLTIFKNVDMLSDMVQDHDEPILKHLQDIKVKFSQSNPMVS